MTKCALTPVFPYILMPTILLIVLAGCSRTDSAESGKDGGPHDTRERIRRTLSDGGFSTLSVDCHLSLVRTGERIVAELVFENVSPIPVKIPYWWLIRDGRMTWWAFKVSRDGIEIPYTCKMASRLAATDADRIRVNAGATFSTETTISECYDFAAPGKYQVQYVASISVPEQYEYLEIVSNSVELVVP